jgi:hypothetical protein
VGYDLTMQKDDKNKVEFISCDDKKFKVINVLFKTQSLIEHATCMWEIQCQEKRYILKDAWIEVSCPVPEYKFLAQPKGCRIFLSCSVEPTSVSMVSCSLQVSSAMVFGE